VGEGDIAVGAGTGVLVAGSVGCAVGAQPIKTRLRPIITIIKWYCVLVNIVNLLSR
jgi:hypothetical protein